MSKHGHFRLPGVCPDKCTLDVGFTDESAVQLNVPVVKYFYKFDGMFLSCQVRVLE